MISEFFNKYARLTSYAFACLISLASTSAIHGAGHADKPNIIVILADDVGIGDISAYGATMMSTPNIDRMAAEGMRFTQAYSAGSVCSPSRYGIITGEYPSRGPIKGKALRAKGLKFGKGLTIDLDLQTVPSFLKDQGYKTAGIGKWHLNYGDNRKGVPNWAGPIKPGPLEIGFDYHFGVPRNHNDNFKTYIENHHPIWLKEGITELKNKPELEDLVDYRRDDEVDATLTRKACEFIEANKDQPFFIYLALVAAHTHVTPAEQFRGTSEAGQYGDYIHELDHHVGTINKFLEKLGLADNTLVIFTSDNGGQSTDASNAGENVRVRSDAQDVSIKSRTAKTVALERGHKTNLDLNGYKAGINEGGSRVPFIAKWPGKIKAGQTTDAVISLVDLLATFSGITGVPLEKGAGVDSFDQTPILLGKKITGPIRTTTVLQASNGRFALRQGDWKLILQDQPTWQSIDKVTLSKKKMVLYDLAKDPRETNNLIAEYPEKAESMFKMLDAILNGGSTHRVPL